MTDFAEQLYSWLPGLYRDKDANQELRRFLDIAAAPLSEIESSIEKLREDFYAHTCLDEFIPLIGSLLGIEGDPSLPAFAQRAELANALSFYRSKGMAVPVEDLAREITGMCVFTVDFSQRATALPFIQEANPLIARRRMSPAEAPAGSGHYSFREDGAFVQLYDSGRGRRIRRTDLAGHEAEFAGVDGRFSIKERGLDIFTRTALAYTAVAADLTDFSQPKNPAGAPLTIGANQVAVDPELGRFLIPAPVPLAGNLAVDYHELVPESLSSNTFDIRDPKNMARLSQPDDPAPYTVDFRSPRYSSDRVGRMHFDNYGFFLAPGKIVYNQPPNLLRTGPPETFSFDGRPLAASGTSGVVIQLQDGFDGSPLTRRKLAGHETDFSGTTRGFTILIGGVSVLDPNFQPPVAIRAADLSDPDHPKDAAGVALVLAPTDIAVDPQAGRFVLDAAALGIPVEQLRVNYIVGAVAAVTGGMPGHPDAANPQLFSFAADGRPQPLRDRLDGIQIAQKLRLGVPLTDFNGKPRGWAIRRNGTDVSGTLTAAVQSLDPAISAIAARSIAIDLDRGWFQFGAGVLAPGDTFEVDFGSDDPAFEPALASLAQRLPRMLPAGVSPVITDSRRRPISPAVLS